MITATTKPYSLPAIWIMRRMLMLCQYFVSRNLAIIRAAHPACAVRDSRSATGGGSTRACGNGVEVTGFIKDLAAKYNEASVVVAPLRFGAGTQNKVLEAMAMGIPVVCSNIGFAGLGIAQGEGAFMQTAPEAFAQSVIELLNNEALRRATGMKGVSRNAGTLWLGRDCGAAGRIFCSINRPLIILSQSSS